MNGGGAVASPRLTSRSLAEVAEATRTQRRMSTPMEGLSRTRGSWGGGNTSARLSRALRFNPVKHLPSDTQTSQADCSRTCTRSWQVAKDQETEAADETSVQTDFPCWTEIPNLQKLLLEFAFHRLQVKLAVILNWHVQNSDSDHLAH